MTLEFTEAAVLDLQSIRNYTLERWGEEQEQTYLDGLWDRFGQIKEDPERWRTREDLFPGCRIAVQEQHVILFSLKDDVLQIVRILHGAMDFQRHLTEE